MGPAQVARKTTLLFFAVIFFITHVFLNFEIRMHEAAFVPPPVEQTQQWNAELFKALTFGHWPAAVDWLWMRAIQDDQVKHVEKGKHPLAFYDLDLATDIDPAFYDIYVHGGNLLTVVRNDNIGARDLLIKGERFRTEELPKYSSEFRNRFWPNEAALPMALGYVYLFELGDIPNATKVFHAASTAPGVKEYAKSLAERLSTVEGRYEVAARVLGQMLNNTKSVKTRQILQEKLYYLRVSQELDLVRREFEEYVQKRLDQKKINAKEVSIEERRSLWKHYTSQIRGGTADSFGGEFSLNEKGEVMTSTPFVKVLGLE